MNIQKFKFFFNKYSKPVYKLDTFISILGVTCYFFGYYFVTIYSLIHLIVRVLQIFSKTFANKLISFKNDQEIIKSHYLKDFKFFYYFAMIVRVITGCFYIYFFYLLSLENIEQYGFVFFTITYIFILTNLIDLGIVIYIILYKNDSVKGAVINLCYNCATKGIPALGALHMSSNVPMISPNPVTNYYHLYSPSGRGYGAYSRGQLIKIDFLKTQLGGKFDYIECLDSNRFLDPKKIQTYAQKNNISINSISLDHNFYWWSKKPK